MIIDIEEKPVAEIQLNWKAYFLRFCQEHGGYPVNRRGRLLFSDGWEYSSSDYAGPEWAPPTDPETLIGIQAYYWTTRAGIVKAQLMQLESQFNNLRQLQSSKSAPLQHVVNYVDRESRSVVKQVIDLNLDTLKNDILDLKDYAEHCRKQLKELEKVCYGKVTK